MFLSAGCAAWCGFKSARFIETRKQVDIGKGAAASKHNSMRPWRVDDYLRSAPEGFRKHGPVDGLCSCSHKSSPPIYSEVLLGHVFVWVHFVGPGRPEFHKLCVLCHLLKYEGFSCRSIFLFFFSFVFLFERPVDVRSTFA